MLLCKFCNSGNLYKNGRIRNKQRHKCKSCFRSQVASDDRVKYSQKFQKTTILEMNELYTFIQKTK